MRCAVVLLLVTAIGVGGYYGFTQLGTPPQPSTSVPDPATVPIATPTKTYTLNVRVTPEGGGQVQISTPNGNEAGLQITKAYEPGTQITLTAIPKTDCYGFGRWEIGDTLDWGETITITMDSNKKVTHYFKLEDTTPPAILDVAVVHAKTTDISATITWNTDEPAKGQVEYGKTEADSQPTPTTKEFTTSHSVRLTGLEPNTTYYFTVKAEDKCGNEANTVTGKLKTSDTISAGHEVGKRAPGFELAYWEDPNPLDPRTPNKGGKATLTAFRGKIVLLNFWSTRCGACLKEFPLFWEIYHRDNRCKENTGELAIITIGLDGRTDRIKLVEDEYHSEYCPFTFPILLEKEVEPVRPKYRIWRIPTTFLIDEDGIIRGIRVGRFENMDDINKFISDSSR